MSFDSAGPIPPPASKAPDAKLIRNVRELCVRIVRGKAAAQNPSVWWQRVLGIASILLSSLGSVGVIADKAAANLHSETGGAFWGSVILLLFGIVSQIANQLQVAKRAADSESLAVRCGLYETRLENMLIDDDPRTSVGGLLVEVNTLFEKEQYNQVLPRMTDEMKIAAAQWAGNLTADNQKYWQLKVKKQQGVTKRPAAPPAPEAESPGTPERRQDS
jgi:hypothetical protein